MDATLHISIFEAEFEDEGNYYVKFEVLFWGQPSEKSPRTDVSTPPSRHPQFNPNVFAFPIPSKRTSLVAKATKQDILKVTVTAVRVEKGPDGSATVNKVGNYVAQFSDLASLKADKMELVAFTSETLPGFPAKIVGHIRLGFALNDGEAGSSAEPPRPTSHYAGGF
ncbi:hypothetical protein HDU98_009247, partial [Podochytrium sp. JEL0797]